MNVVEIIGLAGGLLCFLIMALLNLVYYSQPEKRKKFAWDYLIIGSFAILFDSPKDPYLKKIRRLFIRLQIIAIVFVLTFIAGRHFG